MKIVNELNEEVEVSGGTGAMTSFQIQNVQLFMGNIIKNTYKVPDEAVMQELSANSLGFPGAEVHLPTMLEPWLSFIDQGPGMNKEDCILHCSGLGSTTKNTDNSNVGGFGIGMKTPFTITDQYLVISRNGGMKYTFSAFKDEVGHFQFVLLKEEEWDRDDTGLEVKVPVKDKHSRWVDVIKKKLKYFNPKPKTNIEVEWDEDGVLAQGSGWKLLKKRGEGYYSTNVESVVVMGQLAYPLDGDEVREEWNDKYTRLIGQGMVLDFNIGDIKLPMSREALIYDDNTIQLIRDKLDEVAGVLVKELQVELDMCSNMWDAMTKYKEGKDILSQLRIREPLLYKGKKLNDTTVELEGITKGHHLTKDRWRLKSLTMQGYNMRVKYPYVTLPDGNKKFDHTKVLAVNVPHTTKECIWMTLDLAEKRVPSRLLAFMSSQHPDKILNLLYYDGDRQPILDVLLSECGLTEHSVYDFTLHVPEIKIAKRGAVVRKKTAKVKVLSDLRRVYWSHNSHSDHWDDKDVELDMSVSTGIYVDLRNNVPHGHRPGSNQRLRDEVTRLKNYGLIPDDTVVYGCPGSYKNRLKDHPNFISIDEAIDIGMDVARGQANNPQMQRYRDVHDLCKERSILTLDIPTKDQYYSVLGRVNKKFTTTVCTTDTYKEYLNGCMYVEQNSTTPHVPRNNDIAKRFDMAYPLAKYLDNATKQEVQEYLQLNLNCKGTKANA